MSSGSVRRAIRIAAEHGATRLERLDAAWAEAARDGLVSNPEMQAIDRFASDNELWGVQLRRIRTMSRRADALTCTPTGLRTYARHVGHSYVVGEYLRCLEAELQDSRLSRDVEVPILIEPTPVP